MKFYTVVLLFAIALHPIIAQTNFIKKEIDGELVAVKKIFNENENELFGYFILKDMGFTQSYKRKYDYEILDKNYNKVLNGSFIENIYHKKYVNLLKTVLTEVLINDNQILFQYGFKIDNSKFPNSFSHKLRFLNLSNNKISEPFYNDGQQLKPTIELEESEIKPFQKNDLQTYYSGGAQLSYFVVPNKGFLCINYEYGQDSPFIFNNEGKKVMQIDHEMDKDGYLFPSLIDKDYLINVSRKIGEDIIIAYDYANEGKKIFSRKHGSDKYSFYAKRVKQNDNEIYVLGEVYIQQSNGNRNPVGIYKRIIDRKTGDEKKLDVIQYSKFPKNLNIDNQGKIEGKGKIVFQYFDISPNGDVLALAETYKERSRIDIYNNIILINLDQDMKIKKAESFEAAETKGYKFSYAQDLPENEGKMICFLNKDEDKNWELLTFAYKYKTDEIVRSQITLEKNEGEISFSPSKKGFISILEFYKKAKPGEKQVELRIEKLKY